MPGELGRQPFVHDIILSNDEQARSVLVDPVDNAGPRDAADAGQPPCAMMKQCVDQGPVAIACGRMDDQAGRLVDHDQMLVLVDDGECNILRHIMGRRGLRQAQLIIAARPRLGGRIAHRDTLGIEDAAAADQRLDALA